jgi:hypothetical protein
LLPVNENTPPLASNGAADVLPPPIRRRGLIEVIRLGLAVPAKGSPARCRRSLSGQMNPRFAGRGPWRLHFGICLGMVRRWSG